MTSDAQIKAFIDRILRLKEEQDSIGDDIRDIYAEAKSMGFDKTAVGNVVAHLRKVAKKGHDTVAEQGAVFDLYLAAYEGHAPAPARARENIEKFDREGRAKLRTSEAMDDNKALSAQMLADGLISEEAHAEHVALSDAVAKKYGAGVIDPEIGEILDDAPITNPPRPSINDEACSKAVPQDAPSPAGIGSELLAGREGRHEGEAVSANLPTNSELPSDERVSPTDVIGSAVANAGGEHVDRSAERAVPETDTAAGGVESREVDNVKIDASGPDEKQRATHSPEEAPNSLTKTEEEAEATGAATVDTASRADEESDRQRASGAGPADGRQHGGGDPLAAAGDHAPNFTEDVRGVVYEAAPCTPMKSLNYANCFPELSRAAYERLAADIAERGVQQPIVRMGDVIVDGWSRYNVCRTIGMEYPVVSYSGNDVLLDVIAWQREARQFTPAQEQQIAARLAKEIPHRAADIMAAFEIAEELA